MYGLVELWDNPVSEEKFMIAGWQQWADAGQVSSMLPQYLITQTGAVKIGQIGSENFYLFQVPGTHHLLRPEVALEDGHRKSMALPKNELYYAGNPHKGLVLFMGEEPHFNVEKYAEAFLDAVEELDVQKIALLGGVYGPVPYGKDREISCIYSLPRMKAELDKYAVTFSNYEGGISISTYIVQAAEARDLEVFGFYAVVPAYDFSPLSNAFEGLRIESDFKAWYDVIMRFNHMFDMRIDLSKLRQHADILVTSMESKVREMQEEMPDMDVSAYMQQVNDAFTEKSFVPLSDVWEKELGDLLDDLENHL